jgi:hypothetical protein
VLLAVSAIAACSGPLDQHLITGSTPQAYRASLDAIYPKMTVHEQEAFDWAVSDFDLPKLHSKYPEASPKAVIRGEVQEVLQTYPAKVKALEVEARKQSPLRAELRKIVAQRAIFRMNKNFFGLQPTVIASIANNSKLPVSRLDWRAALFLNDATEPVATTTLSSDYRNDGGLAPRRGFISTFKVGFVRGDESWSTLEIRNAAKTRVVLEPILDSIQDFGDRPYLTEDVAKRIENMRGAVAAAKSFDDI